MKLDFSQCKTAEDVKKVFDQSGLKQQIKKLTDAVTLLDSKQDQQDDIKWACRKISDIVADMNGIHEQMAILQKKIGEHEELLKVLRTNPS